MSVGSGAKPGARSELFWAVDRAERYRYCAELATLAGRIVIVARSAADASKIANELSRHGVPAASLEHRDFGADYLRAQVITDETAMSCERAGAPCVVQFDPAGGPRRYRRRIDLLAARRALVVTFVVPERLDAAHLLLTVLDRPVELGPVDMAAARRAIILATNVVDNEPAPPPSATTRISLVKDRLRLWVSVNRMYAGVVRRARSVIPTRLQRGGEATVDGDQRAS